MVCDYDLKIGQLLETMCFPKSCKANELKLENIISCHPMLIIPSILFSNSWMLTDLNGANTVWERLVKHFSFSLFSGVHSAKYDNDYWTFFLWKIPGKDIKDALPILLIWGNSKLSGKVSRQSFRWEKKHFVLLTLLSSNVSVRTINSSIHYFCLTFLVI